MPALPAGGKNSASVVRLRGLVPPRLQSIYNQLEEALRRIKRELGVRLAYPDIGAALDAMERENSQCSG